MEGSLVEGDLNPSKSTGEKLVFQLRSSLPPQSVPLNRETKVRFGPINATVEFPVRPAYWGYVLNSGTSNYNNSVVKPVCLGSMAKETWRTCATPPHKKLGYCRSSVAARRRGCLS